MPIVVIGGGLTAIDTATESLAYYVVQVEKFLKRYETAGGRKGRSGSSRERGRAEEARNRATNFWRMRGRFARNAQRRRAKGGSRGLIELLNSWGGVTIAYRRRMIDSPSYTLNHEEVAKALEEGVRFAECLTPEEVEIDAHGAAAARCGSRSSVSTKATGKLSRTGETVRAARAKPFWWPPARSRIRFWRAKTSTTSRSMAAISRRWMKRANR